MNVKDRLRNAAAAHGIERVGFCRADPFPEVRSDLEAAVTSGRSASLRFTFSNPDRASDPTHSFAWARSLVAAAVAYPDRAGRPPPRRRGRGKVARFATADHYRPLREALRAMAACLHELGHRAEVLCDDNRLVDRAVAVRSGIGWWGKSAMVLAPGAGPWMLLGEVVTEVDLAPDLPMVRDCGTCVACIPACPTGAIVAPGVLDSRRCIAALLQAPGWVPPEMRSAVDDRFYGCDDCLTACPPGERIMEGVAAGGGGVDMAEVLGLDDRSLRERFAHFYVPRNDASFLRRNALVVLGNNGGEQAVPVVAPYLKHADPMLRGHAVWALGRIGGHRSQRLLASARQVETHPRVLEEFDRALGTL